MPSRGQGRGEGRRKADTTSTPQQRVNVILRKLGEPLYRNFLRATFGPRKGPDARRYTATHAALLVLPFRGYVTTNYDSALEFARAELRPESLSTGKTALIGHLARDCRYAWAERDALFLEAETRAVLSARHDPDNASAATRERETSRRNRAGAETLAARLVLSEEDLAAADAKPVEWLKDWEKNAKKK